MTAFAKAVEGHRNHELNRSAFALGQLVAAEALDESETAEALHQTGLGLGLGEREVRRTVDSGLTAGMAQPRDMAVGD